MPAERAAAELARMRRAMQHEASYVSGCHCDAAQGVYATWVERAGSFSSRMPVHNETGELTLLFSGEEFPVPGTAQRLREQGHRFEESAAAYLPHLCEEDETFPANLNGWFHGLLINQQRGTATLFNDRYGMHRVYVHQSADAFYFAGEAKAILAVRPELRQLDLKSLGEFVTCGCVLENRSLFRGIELLPAGSAWTFREAALEQKKLYFDSKEWEAQDTLEPEAYYDALRDVFSQNVGRYFDGAEPAGVSLTGGLDSRMIMAWQRQAAGTLPTYSFGGMYRDCADVVIARQVAEACGQPHQVLPVNQDFLSKFPHYAERTVYLTDGCVAVNHAPDLYVNERAAKIAPVRITGNYGGEVLRQVRAFKPMKHASPFLSEDMLPYKQAGEATYQRVVQEHPLTFAAFRQAPWHHYSLLSLEQTQVSLRSPFLDNDFVKTLYRSPASCLTNNDVSLRLIADGNAALGKIPTDRGLTLQGGLPTRLRNEWIEFTVKAEYAYDYGMPQWLAKLDRSLSAVHLERLFLGRHKFAHFRLWYRDQLGAYVQEMLLDSRTLSRSLYQRETLETMVREHLSGQGNHTLGIHKALSLELIHRQLLDA